MTEKLEQSITDEVKEQTFKHTLSKFEHDLFNEDDDVVNKVIRVKRVMTGNKVESWKIYEDNKIKFTLDGAKLAKKEKEFLRTVDGLNFLIAEGKKGIKSLHSIKKAMKDYLL